MSSMIEQFISAGILEDFDRYLAATLRRLDPGTGEQVLLAAALARAGIGKGHICLDLEKICAGEDLTAGELPGQALPPLPVLLPELAASPLVGNGETTTPLVLEGNRLYLQRYWRYEAELAEMLLARAKSRKDGLDEARLDRCLAQLFSEGAEVSRQQREACRRVFRQRLGIISGGPGTGKTTLIARCLALALLYAHDSGAALPGILLLAPTGKAAARLSESLAARQKELKLPAELLAAMPLAASTIHRALGYRPKTPTSFRHDRKNPLPQELIVVDEASMVDMALMAKLFAAVNPRSSIVLLGDRDQLSSVEAGSILGDICRAALAGARTGGEDGGAQAGLLADCVVELRKSYRFKEDSPIGMLAAAVNSGAAAKTLALLAEESGGVRFFSRREEGEGAWPAGLAELIRASYAPIFTAPDPHAALAVLATFRILCAHRHGPDGVAAMNGLVERLLGIAGKGGGGGLGYKGRPILIQENNYRLRLFNGDTGIIWPSAGGEPQAFFPGEEKGALRAIPLMLLPAHETAYAMTIHKSQGSEFERVALILPQEDFPLLSRELLYTGITRARQEVMIIGSAEVVGAAVSRRVERASGLGEKLAG